MAKHKPWMDVALVCPVCGVSFYPTHFRQRYCCKRCNYVNSMRLNSAFGRAMSLSQAIEYYGSNFDAWNGYPRRHARFMTVGQRHPATGLVKLADD